MANDDVELRFVANTDPYIEGIREAQKANQQLYDKAKQGAKQEEEVIRDITNEIKRMELAKKAASSTKAQDQYNKKILEAKMNLQDAKEKLQEYNKTIKEQDVLLKNSSKGFDILKGGIMKLIGPLVSVAAAYKAFQFITNSTKHTADALAIAKAGLTAQVDVLAKSIATLDFANMVSRMREARDAAREQAEVMAELGDRYRSLKIYEAEQRHELSLLMATMRDYSKTEEERSDAMAKYKDIRRNIVNETVELTSKELEVASNALAKKLNLQGQELENFIRYYNKTKNIREQALKLEGKEIDQAVENMKTLKISEKNYLKFLEDISEGKKQITEADLVLYRAYLDKYGRAKDEELDGIAELMLKRQQAVNQEAEDKVMLQRIENQLYREREAKRKEEEARIKQLDEQRLKDRQKFLSTLLSLEDEAELNRISHLEGDERIEAEHLFALKMLERSKENFKKELEESKLSNEEKKKIQAEHDAAMLLVKDRINEEHLQKTMEFHFNEHFTQEAANEEKERIQREHNENMQKLRDELELAEADIQDPTGLKTLEILMARKRKEIKLLESAGDEESAIRARLAQTELAELNSKWDAIYAAELEGFEGTIDIAKWGWKEYVDAVADAVGQVMSLLSQLNNTQLETVQRERELLDTAISQRQQALNNEIAIAEKGYASDIDLERKRIESLEKQREEALKKEEEAIKQKQKLDSIQQATSLITASANILASYSSMPIVGQILAIAAIATMFTAFAKAKVDAAKAAKLAKGGSGTKTGMVTGKSHAQGGESFTDHIEVERGEHWGVLSASKAKYANDFHAIVDAMNKGKYSPSMRINIPAQREKQFRPSELIAIRDGINKLNRHFSNEEKVIEGNGYRLIKKGNLTRKING